MVIAAGLAQTADGRLEVTAREVDLAETNGDGAVPLLELRNLVKEFPITSGAILQRKVAAVHAVSDVSFAVSAGTTFGLVGESGCGKTTLGKMIVALEKPNSGAITLGGRRCPSCAAANCGVSAATCSSCSRTRTPPWIPGCGSARS